MSHIEKSVALLLNVHDTHSHIALWSSGGKDSLTTMHLARPYANKITVIHNGMGDDGWPGETENLSGLCELWGYKLIIVKPPMPLSEYAERYGWPSHVVPADMDGSFPSPWVKQHKVSSHWFCSLHQCITPILQATNEGGYDAVLTGSRKSDAAIFETMGDTVHDANQAPWTRYNPIIQWTTEQVYDYIDANHFSLPPHYDYKRYAKHEVPDCRACPWSAGHVRWLKEHAPEDFIVLQNGLSEAAKESNRHIKEEQDMFNVLFEREPQPLLTIRMP